MSSEETDHSLDSIITTDSGTDRYREVIFEQKGSIAVLTLNRPDIRNAFTHQEMIDEIVDVCQRVQDTESVSVLVVTGAGSAFSAGGNVKDMYHKEGMFSGDPNDVRQNYRKGIQRVTPAFQRLDVPAMAGLFCCLASWVFPKRWNWRLPAALLMQRRPSESGWSAR